MSNLKNALTRKLGPLPVWAWAIVAFGGLWYYRNKTANATQSGTGTGSVGQATQHSEPFDHFTSQDQWRQDKGPRQDRRREAHGTQGSHSAQGQVRAQAASTQSNDTPHGGTPVDSSAARSESPCPQAC
jgi:hypothetical protein